METTSRNMAIAGRKRDCESLRSSHESQPISDDVKDIGNLKEGML
jgi:hypothetical protein